MQTPSWFDGGKPSWFSINFSNLWKVSWNFKKQSAFQSIDIDNIDILGLLATFQSLSRVDGIKLYGPPPSMGPRVALVAFNDVSRAPEFSKVWKKVKKWWRKHEEILLKFFCCILVWVCFPTALFPTAFAVLGSSAIVKVLSQSEMFVFWSSLGQMAFTSEKLLWGFPKLSLSPIHLSGKINHVVVAQGARHLPPGVACVSWWCFLLKHLSQFAFYHGITTHHDASRDLPRT